MKTAGQHKGLQLLGTWGAHAGKPIPNSAYQQINLWDHKLQWVFEEVRSRALSQRRAGVLQAKEVELEKMIQINLKPVYAKTN